MVKGVHDDHSSNGHVTLSSIALLQERFRQLEKMKELRQEKELLKTLSESERNGSRKTFTPPHDRATTAFSGSGKMFISSPSPHCQLSLSLWPDSQKIKYEDQSPSSSTLAKSHVTDHATMEFESCVDTSLRL
ncbi:hypothetical protein OROGR_012568 [Orobanche gracilis]